MSQAYEAMMREVLMSLVSQSNVSETEVVTSSPGQAEPDHGLPQEKASLHDQL